MSGSMRILLCIVLLFCLSLPLMGQITPAEIDTAFWDLSLRELEGYRTFYRQELDFLQQEKDNLILRGIADGEKLLESNPDASVLDGILIRLADLYFYKEKDDFLKAMSQYDDWLETASPDPPETPPVEPQIQFTRSLSLYERIIDEFPKSQMVDDALYNKGFIYEELGDYDTAILIYESLIQKHPGSKYVPESYMRMGEYYFNPPQNELEKAISCYQKVIERRRGPRYLEALYKLGWSHYRLSKYPEAISYFTTLIESVDQLRELNSDVVVSGMMLREEAVEYVAISFIDFGGPESAESYIKQIGSPDWGFTMMQRLGDIYMNDKEDYRLAVMTYGKLRRMAKNTDQAPIIQKKIIDCYTALSEDASAFQARSNLFLDYSPNSTWWQKSQNEKLKLDVYRLTEEALRNNFHAQLKSASEINDTLAYNKAVNLGRKYLETFPEDLFAYMIRWNVALMLDTKLYRYKEALQEYLTITLAYNIDSYLDFAREKGLATIKDAAENAIVVADSLYRFEQRGLEVDLSGLENGDDKSEDSMPFTPAAKWLAMAYDNYLKLFPFEENTPTILANAGALYYTHNQFDESIKYFKTLLRYFPDSRQAQHVQYSILETYFGKKDYDSVENLAKKILSEDYSNEIKDKSRQRMGESIFLKAQALAEIGRSDLAAEEFLRLTLEVPQIDFADRAVFNAAREFDKDGQYHSAIRAYEQLRISYPGSSHLVEALNNLAFDYSELGEFEKGANQYAALVPLLKEGTEKKDAMYNAHVFYVKAENWRRAVETGEQYIAQYPDAEDTPTLYFRIGQYWKNLGEPFKAKQVYKAFIHQFPESLHCVEASYFLGRCSQKEDSLIQAIRMYDQAEEMNTRLKANGLPGNDFYAAEALFHGTELLQQEFEANP
ncbi:tetratricopeptide repeat protein, partial [candidate division KSB1 bacterium]|nr:tetratricopeptide repeat protein [candidate division KSB1 bacterium]